SGHPVKHETITEVYRNLTIFQPFLPYTPIVTMPKDTSSSSSARAARRHNPLPLHEELLAHDSVRVKTSRSKRQQKGSVAAADDDDDDKDGHPNGKSNVVSKGLSRKILQIAKEQQDEVELEQHIGASAAGAAASKARPGSGRGAMNGPTVTRFTKVRVVTGGVNDSDDSGADDDEEDDEDDDDELGEDG